MTRGFTYSVKTTEEEFNSFKGIKIRYDWLGKEHYWVSNKKYNYISLRELKQDIAMFRIPYIITNEKIIRYCIVRGLRELGATEEIMLTNAKDEVYYPEREVPEIDQRVKEKLELVSLKRILNRDSLFILRDVFPE